MNVSATTSNPKNIIAFPVLPYTRSTHLDAEDDSPQNPNPPKHRPPPSSIVLLGGWRGVQPADPDPGSAWAPPRHAQC